MAEIGSVSRQLNELIPARNPKEMRGAIVTLLAENCRLRCALEDMVAITKRNSSAELILTAIRKCAEHALTAAKHTGA